tara:strand:- start:2835 stop:3455 length:621 start_codon:yes stop_codon:yes gene_type:complete
MSDKNPTYCEMTAIYWAWKNDLMAEHVGLCHYRRYFTLDGKVPLSPEQYRDILSKYDMILPKKRNYYIDNVWDHYAYSHHIKDMVTTRDVIAEIEPNYLDSFDKIMKGKSVSLYNMFIYNSKDFYEYASWLFPILEEVEKRSDIKDYSNYQKRVFGFIAERLHNVYIERNFMNKKIKYLKTLEPESVGYVSKAAGMIKRRLGFGKL